MANISEVKKNEGVTTISSDFINVLDNQKPPSVTMQPIRSEGDPGVPATSSRSPKVAISPDFINVLKANSPPSPVTMQPIRSKGDPQLPATSSIPSKAAVVASEARVKPVGAVFSSPVDPKDGTTKLSVLSNQRISHNKDNHDGVNAAGWTDVGATVNLTSNTWVQGTARLAPGYNGKTGEYDPTVTVREATVNHKVNDKVQVGAGIFRRPDDKYLDNFNLEPGPMDWPGNLATKNPLTQGFYAQYNDGSTYAAGSVAVDAADKQYRLYGDKVEPTRGAAVSGVVGHNWKVGEHDHLTAMASGVVTQVPHHGNASNLTTGLRYDHGDEKGNMKWGASAGVFTQQDPTMNKGGRIHGVNLGAQYNFNSDTSLIASAAFDSTNAQHYGIEAQRKFDIGLPEKVTGYVTAMHDVDPTGRASNTVLAGVKIPFNLFGGGHSSVPSSGSGDSHKPPSIAQLQQEAIDVSRNAIVNTNEASRGYHK